MEKLPAYVMRQKGPGRVLLGKVLQQKVEILVNQIAFGDEALFPLCLSLLCKHNTARRGCYTATHTNDCQSGQSALPTETI